MGELVDAHYPWLFRQARRLMSPAVRARLETADLVSEVICEFLQHVPRFRIENGKSFRGLLLRIIQNTQLEQYRWWSARRRDLARERPVSRFEVLLLDGDPGPAAAASEQEEEAWIRLGLEFMQPDDLRIIVLRDFDHLPYQEIGETLEITPGAAAMRHTRAVERLTGKVLMLRTGQTARLLEAADGESGRGLADHED